MYKKTVRHIVGKNIINREIDMYIYLSIWVKISFRNSVNWSATQIAISIVDKVQ